LSDTDQRDVLWAPWRIEYITGTRERGCIFCNRFAQSDDRENLILARGSHSFVIMNKFPYNNGHLMVAPIRHTGEFGSLGQAEIVEIFGFVQSFIDVFHRTMNPHGFNIGVNLGKTAGAGVEDHVHVHVVPRWDGDTNFMPVIGEVKVISEHIQSTYNKLLDAYRTAPLREELP
jgi:ATP adenylyltransferase